MLDLLRYVWQHPLNANDRWGALGRLLRWQVASRLMAGPIAFAFVEDTRLFATRGMKGATGNLYCGLHEVHEMAFVLHVLRLDEHFVDVGANIGSYAILGGGGARARVTAVEPIPSTFAHLKRNVALNELNDQVRCFQVGLSEQSGMLRFSSGLDTENRVLAQGEDIPSFDVPVMRLDDLVAGDAPVLMKIDVEGHELSVLQGGQLTLANPRLLAVIMETNGSGARFGVADGTPIAVMREHGFAPFGYDPFARQLVDHAQTAGNTVFVRDCAEVQRRVKTARQFRVGTAVI